MELHHLRYFVAAAHARQLIRVAEISLHPSHPLSHIRHISNYPI